MNKSLAKQIVEDIQCISLKRMEIPTVFLQPFSPAYIPVPLNEKYFITITPAKSEKKIIFVDGGNAEILQAPDFSLQFVRFSAVTFIGKTKTSAKKKEGYILLHTSQQEGIPVLHVTGYGGLSSIASFRISQSDPVLGNGSQRTTLQLLAEIFRSMYEIEFAQSMITKEEDAVLVFDRALLPQNYYEQEALEKLYRMAEQKKILVTGLNKTTALLTNTGESIIHCLRRFEKKGCWVYYPVFESYDPKHNAQMSFVKLHGAAEYIFRFEVHTKKKDCIFSVGDLLAAISNDGAFIGYPYGLVAADQCARVSNKEKNLLKMFFLNHINKGTVTTTALDAHDVLDRQQYL